MRADWRTSVRSVGNGACVEIGQDWRTAAASNPNGECVEVASGVRIRDTKDRGGPVIRVGPDIWRVFLDRIKRDA